MLILYHLEEKQNFLSIKKNRIKPFKLFLELSLALCYKIFRQYLYIYFRFIDKLVTFSCKRGVLLIFISVGVGLIRCPSGLTRSNPTK